MSERSKLENHVRVEIEGDLLGLSALSLQDRLPLADISRAKRVTVSMGNVRHMDQAGLAILVRLYSQLRVRGGDLVLLDVQVPVRKTLERIGLSALIGPGERPVLRSEPARQPQQESAIHEAQPEI